MATAVRAVGVPDQRRLALISVRLPDREIGSTDFNDGLAMTNEGADGVLSADQLKAALAPICAKKFQRSHDSSRTPRESAPALGTLATSARDQADARRNGHGWRKGSAGQRGTGGASRSASGKR